MYLFLYIWFYLQCALTVPHENRVYEIHSSTQLPMIMQSKVASLLKIATADITVKVKRVGKLLCLYIYFSLYWFHSSNL